MAITTFKATTKITSGIAVECEARNMTFVLDEPPELGGEDNGMNPVEALLSALGACKCIVAKSFAKKNRINLKDVRIEVEGELDPDGFMGMNPDAKIGFSKIHSKFYIDADNTPEEIEKFIEFIEIHCPVQDTLCNSPEMTSELM